MCWVILGPEQFWSAEGGGELVSFRYIGGEGFPFQERKDEFMIWANTSSERHRLLIISLCARMTSP